MMKKLIYTIVLLLAATFASQAQTLTVQGTVSNGTLGGIPNTLVNIQINLSPSQVLYDSLFTDALGNFSSTYSISASQSSGVVTAVVFCGGIAINSIDSFNAPNFSTTHIFNCTGGTNPPPATVFLNGQISPTALGDTVIVELYRLSLVGLTVDTVINVVDTMGMGYVNYGFVKTPGVFVVGSYIWANPTYLHTYYGNTTIQSQATFIPANSPGTYNNLNIVLQTTPSLPPTIIIGQVSGYTPAVSGGDTLQAILIEVQNNIWTPIDTSFFIDSSGTSNFIFSTTNTGPYAVLVRLLGANAGNYAPTYHDNVTTWTASTPFSSNPSSNTIVLNIGLQATSGTGTGNGGAGGGVFNGLPFTGSVGMEAAPVYLQDVNGTLLKVAYSRTDGSYNFNNLPFGNYGMRVELFGIPSTTFMFTLSSSTPTVQIDFTLGTNGIAASMEEADLTVLGTYPNPAKDWVRMQLKAKDGQTQTIQLRDVQGRLMLVKNVQLESGMQEIELPLNGFSQGVYLLEITGSQKSVSRLVIQ